jgi:hypothetical protein
MPGGYVPHKPRPDDVFVGLLILFGCGAALIFKGREFHSICTIVVGGLLVAAGIYYTIRYWRASGWKNKN